MKFQKSSGLILLFFLLAETAAVRGQEDVPHIGYIYPAGGKQGSTFEVLIGGLHLDGTTDAIYSGAGLEAEVLGHIRPLNQGQFKEMQNRMGELKKKKEGTDSGSSTGGGRGRRSGSEAGADGEWTDDDEQRLMELRERLSTFSIRRSSVPALVETVALQVTVAPDAEPGERELRLQTELGLTNPVVFCVGQLPEWSEESGRNEAIAESEKRGGKGRKRQSEGTSDPGTAPVDRTPVEEVPIDLPVVVNGQILPGDLDRYRFRARKGQQLIAEVSARKLIPYLSDAVPGWFQAAITLFDAGGNQVAYDDDFRFHPDPVLHCEIPRNGEYVLEIRDSLYRGREDFVYRIAIGELPYVTGVFPLGGGIGRENRVEIGGWNLGDTTHTVPAREEGIQRISVREGESVSNAVPFAVDPLPAFPEEEPNGEPAEAQRVRGGVIVDGRIERSGDVDVFCFECRAGVPFVAEVLARRLDSPLDSVLKLTDSAGEQLAFNDDFEDRAAGLATHHADSKLHARIPRDGVYFLHLGDAQQAGGVEYGYRLRIDRARPDFALRVVPSSINARAGTSVPITVHALRRDGFAGEIALGLKKSPEGFELRGARIPAGQDFTRLTLTVPAQPTGESQQLILEGHAKIRERDVIRKAVPADDRMQAFIYRHLVPAKALLVSVIGSPRRSSVSLLEKGPVRIPAGGMAGIRVKVPQRSSFGEIRLELDNPPEGIHIDEVIPCETGSEIRFRCDRSLAKPGAEGNLIINVFAVKTGEDSGKGKEQRKKRRILLSVLPAIPFEIVDG